MPVEVGRFRSVPRVLRKIVLTGVLFAAMIAVIANCASDESTVGASGSGALFIDALPETSASERPTVLWFWAPG